MSPVILAVCLILVVAAAIFWYYENHTFGTSRYSVLKDVASALYIVQISDLHGAHFGKENKKLLKKIQQLSPDLIVITGDLGSDQKNLQKQQPFLKNLADLAPTCVILGNHESKHGQADLLKIICQNAGCICLQNELTTLTIKGQPVSLLGLCEDPPRYKNFFDALRPKLPKQDPAPLFYKLQTMPGLHIVLSHYPENYGLLKQQSYRFYPFDLQFSGHAHGGQARLFCFSVIAPGQGFFPKYTAGVHENRLVISRGLGNSSVPIRVFNRPELVLVQVLPR